MNDKEKIKYIKEKFGYDEDDLNYMLSKLLEGKTKNKEIRGLIETAKSKKNDKYKILLIISILLPFILIFLGKLLYFIGRLLNE